MLCASNGTIALMMAAKALGLDGPVVVPAFTFPATAQSLLWAGAIPRFCDVGPDNHHLTPDTVAAVIADDVQAILAVNLWGDVCDVSGLSKLASDHGIPLLFFSAQAFGCSINGSPLGRFGKLEVFSFHATKILSATEGGCISTNDDEVAARLRNIRSSYGAGRAVKVPITANGRFSEAQAAIALMSLADVARNAERNQALLTAYIAGTTSLAGLRMVTPSHVDRSNYQYAVLEVNADAFGVPRDQLLAVLKSENVNARRYFHPGLHRTPPFASQPGALLPNTDALCSRVLQLPLGALATVRDVEVICMLLAAIHTSAARLVSELSKSCVGIMQPYFFPILRISR